MYKQFATAGWLRAFPPLAISLPYVPPGAASEWEIGVHRVGQGWQQTDSIGSPLVLAVVPGMPVMIRGNRYQAQHCQTVHEAKLHSNTIARHQMFRRAHTADWQFDMDGRVAPCTTPLGLQRAVGSHPTCCNSLFTLESLGVRTQLRRMCWCGSEAYAPFALCRLCGLPHRHYR